MHAYENVNVQKTAFKTVLSFRNYDFDYNDIHRDIEVKIYTLLLIRWLKIVSQSLHTSLCPRPRHRYLQRNKLSSTKVLHCLNFGLSLHYNGLDGLDYKKHLCWVKNILKKLWKVFRLKKWHQSCDNNDISSTPTNNTRACILYDIFKKTCENTTSTIGFI